MKWNYFVFIILLYLQESIADYLKNCSSTYVKESGARRFLIQRDLYDEVKSTEGVAVHIEPNSGSGGPPTGSSAWISVAAGNVLPDVLLRLTAGMKCFPLPTVLFPCLSIDSYQFLIVRCIGSPQCKHLASSFGPGGRPHQ